MHRPDFIAVAPLLILAFFAVAVMLAIALRRNHAVAVSLSLTGLAAALGVLPFSAPLTPRPVTPLLVVDGFALFYLGLILSAAAAVVVFAWDYLRRLDDLPEEFYFLLLVATLGAGILAVCRHFASLFLGLEILSVSLYGLIAYTRDRNVSIEAGFKYLVLAAVSAAFLLFGAALIYSETGALDFGSLLPLFQAGPAGRQSLMLLSGLGLVITAVGFKLALTPFHMWTPDIYQGAPAPVTAFVAAVSKGAVAALLVRLFAPVDLHQWGSLFVVFAVMAGASMIAGNLLALMQDNIKRILAYSSIAHMGYLLTAFLSGGREAVLVVTFYLTAYIISILGCFGVIAALSSREGDVETVGDIRGLFLRRPWLTGVFTAMLLSLAGIPLTAGFIGKFFVVTVGIQAAHWVLVVILALTSGVGLFYYLKIIIAMFSPAPEEAVGVFLNRPAASSMVALTFAVLSALLLWLGVGPSWLMRMIGKMVG
ncbi:MAG: NADH-quinone oxidoreductase subunit N [Thermodesulfobacteriota bacterium]